MKRSEFYADGRRIDLKYSCINTSEKYIYYISNEKENENEISLAIKELTETKYKIYNMFEIEIDELQMKLNKLQKPIKKPLMTNSKEGI